MHSDINGYPVIKCMVPPDLKKLSPIQKVEILKWQDALEKEYAIARHIEHENILGGYKWQK